MLQFSQTHPLVSSQEVVFRLADPDFELEQVKLLQEVAWPREGPELVRHDLYFEHTLPRPPVDRMEYRYQLRRRGGPPWVCVDPANSLRAPGPFGEKSVIEFPEYRAPTWTKAAPVPRGSTTDFEIPCPSLETGMPCRLWSSWNTRPDQTLPLLIALDGLEYDLYSGLTQMLDHAVARGELPPMRAALLHPVRRDQEYSASPSFSLCLTTEVLPAIGKVVALPAEARHRAVMGASLGGLAALFWHWSSPELLGGLYLQSASVFNHHYSEVTWGFEHMERICSFTELVHSARVAARPIPVVLTCGVVEEILLANLAMAASLDRLGFSAQLVRLRDGHNWVAWRDAFTPHLLELLRGLWR